MSERYACMACGLIAGRPGVCRHPTDPDSGPVGRSLPRRRQLYRGPGKVGDCDNRWAQLMRRRFRYA